VRLKSVVGVRYKFLSKTRTDPELETIHEGRSNDLGGGGLLLQGPIPKLEWIPELLLQRMAVGCNLVLSPSEAPIKVLARVAWIETLDEEAQTFGLGLRFREIAGHDQEAIQRFVIRAQMGP
jgi:c-di-GMP-binding flagellar brake protein YcgR